MPKRCTEEEYNLASGVTSKTDILKVTCPHIHPQVTLSGGCGGMRYTSRKWQMSASWVNWRKNTYLVRTYGRTRTVTRMGVHKK